MASQARSEHTESIDMCMCVFVCLCVCAVCAVCVLCVCVCVWRGGAAVGSLSPGLEVESELAERGVLALPTNEPFRATRRDVSFLQPPQPAQIARPVPMGCGCSLRRLRRLCCLEIRFPLLRGQRPPLPRQHHRLVNALGRQRVGRVSCFVSQKASSN